MTTTFGPERDALNLEIRGLVDEILLSWKWPA
jgi:hypothetical protein